MTADDQCARRAVADNHGVVAAADHADHCGKIADDHPALALVDHSGKKADDNHGEGDVADHCMRAGDNHGV